VEIARHLEVALSVRDRMRGLLGRAQLESDRAMWIRPCKSIHTVGMRFAIDAAFLDLEGRVVRAYRALRPSRVTRIIWRAEGVLELAAGVLDATGTQEGDLLDLGIWLSCENGEARASRAVPPQVGRLNPIVGFASPRVGEAGIAREPGPGLVASREVLKFVPFSLDRSRRVPVYPSPFELIVHPTR
jgi:uncharacterized membrane protein (UPF0127 family)